VPEPTDPRSAGWAATAETDREGTLTLPAGPWPESGPDGIHGAVSDDGPPRYLLACALLI
jgi:hypothetical protein